MRPKSPASRTSRLYFRLYTLEKKAIQLAASKTGLSVSDYIRRCCLEKKLYSRFTEEELSLYRLLVEYRNNFARISNLIKEKKDFTVNLKQLIDNIDQHLNKFANESS